MTKATDLEVLARRYKLVEFKFGRKQVVHAMLSATSISILNHLKAHAHTQCLKFVGNFEDYQVGFYFSPRPKLPQGIYDHQRIVADFNLGCARTTETSRSSASELSVYADNAKLQHSGNMLYMTRNQSNLFSALVEVDPIFPRKDKVHLANHIASRICLAYNAVLGVQPDQMKAYLKASGSASGPDIPVTFALKLVQYLESRKLAGDEDAAELLTALSD